MQAELQRGAHEDKAAAGVVLTGGSAKMQGVVELAEEIFHMPVNLAAPRGVAGLADVVHNPIYATGVGLAMYGQEREQSNGGQDARRMPWRGLLARAKGWLTDNL